MVAPKQLLLVKKRSSNFSRGKFRAMAPGEIDTSDCTSPNHRYCILGTSENSTPMVWRHVIVFKQFQTQNWFSGTRFRLQVFFHFLSMLYTILYWNLNTSKTKLDICVLACVQKCTKTYLRAAVIFKTFPGVTPPDPRYKGRERPYAQGLQLELGNHISKQDRPRGGRIQI